MSRDEEFLLLTITLPWPSLLNLATVVVATRGTAGIQGFPYTIAMAEEFVREVKDLLAPECLSIRQYLERGDSYGCVEADAVVRSGSMELTFLPEQVTFPVSSLKLAVVVARGQLLLRIGGGRERKLDQLEATLRFVTSQISAIVPHLGEDLEKGFDDLSLN